MKFKIYLACAAIIISAAENSVISQSAAHINIAAGVRCNLSGKVVVRMNGNLNNNGTFASADYSKVKFTGTTQELIGGTGTTQFQNAELDNTSDFQLQGHVSLNDTLNMVNGSLNLKSYDLTLGASAAVLGTFGTTRMIIADATGGNTGQLKKVYGTGATNFTFPIGDITTTADYSPVALNFTSNSASRTIGLNVTDLKHPQDLSANNYISRYWSFTDNMCNGTYTYNASFTYTQNSPADLTGNYNYAGIFWWNNISSLWNGLNTDYPGAPIYSVSNVNQTTGTLCGSQFTARESCISPNITFITPDKYKCTRDSVLFKVINTGTAPLSFQWAKAGTDIPNATKSTYIISVLMLSDAGKYSCRVSNPCGSQSAEVNLTVNTAPFIHDTIKDTYVCEGSSISFTFNASGDNLNYQWTKGGSNVTGATNSSISFNNVTKNDENIYSCAVSNNCDTKFLEPFLLYINQEPNINIIPITQTKNQGESISYLLNPLGSPPFSYQWKKNDEIIPGATDNSYQVSDISCDDAGNYSCEISNNCGNIYTPIGTLIVNGCGIFTVSGIVTYDNKNMTPMTNTTVYLSTPEGARLDSTKTDNAGTYTFFDVANGNYKLNCITDKAWGGADPLDALIVNRTFIGIYTFTDMLKKQVADVNIDNKINPTDALSINRRFIGLITKFTLTDWVFTVPSVTVSGGNITQDIMALCAGDVNGSFTPKSKKYIKHDMGEMDDKEIFADLDNDIEVPVYLNDIAEIGALGLKLKVQNGGFKVSGISSRMQDMLYNITEDGVNIAWTALEKGIAASPDLPLFTMKMRKADSWSRELIIQVSSESVLSDIDVREISTERLQIPRLSSKEGRNDYDFSIYPNPTSSNTEINYTLPLASRISIKLYNVLGQKITTLYDGMQNEGQHTLQLDGSSLGQGIYNCEFRINNENLKVKKNSVLIITR